MKITYIFRAQSIQRSIERVFEPVISQMKDNGNDVEIEFARKRKGLIATLLTNMLHFRKVSKNRICHITGDVQYVACLMDPDNTVLTIHDLVPLHNKKVPWYSRWLCYWLWYYIPLLRLKQITCISETTRNDLISYFPWAKHKITVIPNPVDPHFTFAPKEFNSSNPRILHIGTKSNKNLGRVISALDGFKCHLRIIGQLNDEYVNALKIHNIDFSNVYGVSDEQILKEYIECDIVSFPSLFEGFGMPIIEGQALGRAVLTSNIEPMTSVAGSGACLVDPESVASITSGFRLLCKDKMFRDKVIEAGIINAQKFSQRSITDMYRQIYGKLCIIS